MEKGTAKGLLDDNWNAEALAASYRRRRWACALVIVGLVAAAGAGGHAWWFAVGSWVWAIVLLIIEMADEGPFRQACVAEQLRRSLGDTVGEKERRAFDLHWQRGGQEGRCQFTSLENAGKAARLLVETNESQGHVECYEMTYLPELDMIPTRWMRWNADKEGWVIEWSADNTDIGTIALVKTKEKEAAAAAAVVVQSTTSAYWPQ